MSGRRWICFFFAIALKPLGKRAPCGKNDEKLYLILVLLGSFRLSRGVGEVLGAFVELVLHGVDGMAAGTRAT